MSIQLKLSSLAAITLALGYAVSPARAQLRPAVGGASASQALMKSEAEQLEEDRQAVIRSMHQRPFLPTWLLTEMGKQIQALNLVNRADDSKQLDEGNYALNGVTLAAPGSSGRLSYFIDVVDQVSRKHSRFFVGCDVGLMWFAQKPTMLWQLSVSGCEARPSSINAWRENRPVAIGAHAATKGLFQDFSWKWPEPASKKPKR